MSPAAALPAVERRRCFSTLGMKFLLETNRAELIDDDEYFLGKGSHLHSLLTNFHRMDEIEAAGEADLALSLIDEPDSPLRLRRMRKGRYALVGSLVAGERSCVDKRSTIFGNMGLFSKILAGELERRGVYSVHSTSFYDRLRNRLYLVMGGSGSGKSTVLLKAICLGGIEVFGTELTHFSLGPPDAAMIKGSLWQNCRMGNLVFDFPELLGRFEITVPPGDPWHVYRSVSLREMAVRDDSLEGAEIVIVMPRIEGERGRPVLRQVPRKSVAMALYQNMSDKIAPPTLLWGRQFIPGLDDPHAQMARMTAARRFLDEARIISCWSVLSSPADCLEGIFPSRDQGGADAT